MKLTTTRRHVMLGMAGTLAATPLARAFAADPLPPLPKSPVAINVIDIAGNLALTQAALEKYRRDKPNLVSRIAFTKAPAPELAGKLKAQQQAGRTDIDLVLTGIDGMAAGIEQNLYIPTLDYVKEKIPNLMDTYLPGAQKMQGMAAGQGVVVVYTPSGPVMEFNPAKVKKGPTSPAELMAWAKANPNRFLYARPANSGPARIFIMGLPYQLGDSDPTDPTKGWDKTWAYLKELNQYIEYYPSGTGAVMKELGEGSRDMVPSMFGWDINPRALGVVPKEMEVSLFQNTTFILDAHYMAVPKGIPAEKLAVLVDLMVYMLQPAQQAYAYDQGYFYPGPAVKDVPLSMAPKESQETLKEFGRPQYDQWIAERPSATPLGATQLVEMFRKWDTDIGGAKLK
jgi:putative spermidine/putrescine transport system substrate-binding protein